MSTTIEPVVKSLKSIQNIPSATVRFAGDSGDGMQITGDQLTRTAALMGSDVATFSAVSRCTLPAKTSLRREISSTRWS
jgi:hypothetical protein